MSPRVTPYLGIVFALLVGVFVAVFSGETTTPPRAAGRTSSSTLSVVPSVALPPITLPSLLPEIKPEPASSTPATFTPKKAAQPTTPKSEPTPASVSVAAPIVPTTPAPEPAPSSGNASLGAASTALRDALVNIICYAPAGSGLHSISGSGIFVDPKGIILTNAHVAQYFLLTNQNISCIIRSGSPAVEKYSATLVFISPAWIRANASLLTQAAPVGTGEYDFALLAVTKSSTPDSLPSSFPSISLAQLPPSSGTPVVIASFGAQFLETSQIQSYLFPTVVFGSVKDIYTFDTNTIDTIALGGSAAAQEGSSGGGVANASGELTGTITTSTVTGSTDTRSLSAITASYIRAEYARETGSTLESLLNTAISASIANFDPQASALESVLTAFLP